MNELYLKAARSFDDGDRLKSSKYEIENGFWHETLLSKNSVEFCQKKVYFITINHKALHIEFKLNSDNIAQWVQRFYFVQKLIYALKHLSFSAIYVKI